MQFKRLPIRLVSEEELQRLREEYTRRMKSMDGGFLETVKIPFRCDENEMCDKIKNLIRVRLDHRELVVEIDEKRFEKRITLPREFEWTDIKLILSRNGWLMIWVPMNKRNNLKSNVDNKLMLDGTPETEEYRQMRKYLKELERIHFPETFCTRITRRKNNPGTKIQFKFNCRGFLKEEVQVVVKEAEAKITIEGRQERKNEFGVSMQNFRRELVKLPIKMIDLKQLRTTFTEEKWLLIEIPTVMDLMPTLRQKVDEEIEVKRA
jgi:HSP20 family molecular chaperone IbpA